MDETGSFTYNGGRILKKAVIVCRRLPGGMLCRVRHEEIRHRRGTGEGKEIMGIENQEMDDCAVHAPEQKQAPKSKYRFELRNWAFMARGKEFVMVCGNVYGSPKYPDGAWIHTSHIRRVQEHENELEISAGSGNYHCAYADHQEDLSDLDECLPQLKVLHYNGEQRRALAQKITEAAEPAAAAARKALAMAGGPDALDNCAVLTFDTTADYYFVSEEVKKNGHLRMTPDGELQAGTFQPTIVLNRLSGVQFGYFFFASHRVEFFEWPEDVGPVYGRNCGPQPIEIVNKHGLFLVQPGECLPLEADSAVGRISKHITAGGENAKVLNIHVNREGNVDVKVER